MRPAWALICVLLSAPIAHAGDPVAGRSKAEAERCFECHGAEGQGDGQAGAHFPRLAGQRAAYLVAQLKSYRSGARKSDVMRLNTQHLDDADLYDIAAWFESRAPMRGGGRGNDAGHALFMQACASCHGEGGRGGVQDTPNLAGQDARYLEQQLLDWRSAWRVAPVMNQATKALSDAEIRALAAYLSSQR
jgi:cytochrome c553